MINQLRRVKEMKFKDIINLIDCRFEIYYKGSYVGEFNEKNDIKFKKVDWVLECEVVAFDIGEGVDSNPILEIQLRDKKLSSKGDCENPNLKSVGVSNLRNGNTQSCGCSNKDKCKNTNKSNIRIEETNLNIYGSKMTILEYNNAHDILVRFDDNYIVKAEYKEFKKGNILSPYDKTVYGIGYYGEGKYKTTTSDGEHTMQYSSWHKILERCYSEKFQEKHPTYKECSVCKEWCNFQNFAKWFDENYYEIPNEEMALDKDILVKGNKIYSPECCVFVSQSINSLFTKNNIRRGKYPIGVFFKTRNSKFCAQCSMGNGIQKYLGLFDTPIEAFNKYKNFKESLIKEIANKYKEYIPKNLYEAMHNYIIKIDD